MILVVMMALLLNTKCLKCWQEEMKASLRRMRMMMTMSMRILRMKMMKMKRLTLTWDVDGAGKLPGYIL